MHDSPRHHTESCDAGMLRADCLLLTGLILIKSGEVVFAPRAWYATLRQKAPSAGTSEDCTSKPPAAMSTSSPRKRQSAIGNPSTKESCHAEYHHSPANVAQTAGLLFCSGPKAMLRPLLCRPLTGCCAPSTAGLSCTPKSRWPSPGCHPCNPFASAVAASNAVSPPRVPIELLHARKRHPPLWLTQGASQRTQIQYVVHRPCPQVGSSHALIGYEFNRNHETATRSCRRMARSHAKAVMQHACRPPEIWNPGVLQAVRRIFSL